MFLAFIYYLVLLLFLRDFGGFLTCKDIISDGGFFVKSLLKNYRRKSASACKNSDRWLNQFFVIGFICAVRVSPMPTTENVSSAAQSTQHSSKSECVSRAKGTAITEANINALSTSAGILYRFLYQETGHFQLSSADITIWVPQKPTTTSSFLLCGFKSRC